LDDGSDSVAVIEAGDGAGDPADDPAGAVIDGGADAAADEGAGDGAGPAIDGRAVFVAAGSTGFSVPRSTIMAMRRLAAARGSAGTSGSRSASPVTRLTRDSARPLSVNSRRVAFARSVDSSQFVLPVPA
jgi:hypothetical protein